MKEIYTKGAICPYNKTPVYCNQKLEPTLTKTMARSRDYHELLHVWKSWRDAVGPEIRQKYIRYVQLANQAARLSGTKPLIHFDLLQQADYCIKAFFSCF